MHELELHAQHTTSKTSGDSAVVAEQVRLLYAGLFNAIALNVILALILAGVQLPAVELRRVGSWLAILGVILLARLWLAMAWRSGGEVFTTDPRRWLRRFRVAVTATGAAWGLGAVLLFPTGNIVYQAYLSFVLAGISAGAVGSLAVDLVSMFGFILPTLAALIVCFAVEDSDLAPGMSVMVTLFLFFISMNAVGARRSLLDNLHLRIKTQHDEEVLRASEERLKRAQSAAHVGHWEFDVVNDRLLWSDETYRIFEIDPAKFEASYEAFLNAIHPDDRERVNHAYSNSLVTRQPYDMVHRLQFAGGRVKFVHERCETEFDAEGKPLRSMGTVQDITEQRFAQIDLRESEMRFRFMLENSPIAACIADVATRQIVFANRRYSELINCPQDNVVGINPDKYYARTGLRAEILERLKRGEEVNNQLVELVIPNHEVVTKWALASYVRLEYQHQPAILSWFYDITGRKHMEEIVQHLADHDPLTDLPNRILFSDRLRQALALARRGKTSVGLVFVDLDRFKPVNDTLGHSVGDQLLKEVAARLRACVRGSDTVGRIGGDEFLVLLPAIREEKDAVDVAEKIRAALNQPFDLESHPGLSISSSAGVAIYPQHGTDERELIGNADNAMYSAKSAGRNTVRVYRPNIQPPA